MLEHEPPGAARTPSTPPDGAASPSQKFYSIPTPTSEHSAIPGLRAAAASFSWLGRGSGGAGGTGGAGDSYQEEGSSESDEVLGSEYYPFRPASHGARAEHDLYGGGGSPQRNHDDSMDADLSDLLSRAKVFDNLRSENLRSENLHSENLRSENLRSENLRSENLRAENLRSENLRSDNLRADNLRTENLRSENLRAENLRSDHLRAQHRSSSTRNFNEPHIETRGAPEPPNPNP
ncbi:hypothetical protein T484DRAFT_1804040 [Baffinella frigidus]|nr:hypothetical protein T484DRAFT_1804040 [Cryptophyta sp. CCMP2293]